MSWGSPLPHRQGRPRLSAGHHDPAGARRMHRRASWNVACLSCAERAGAYLTAKADDVGRMWQRRGLGHLHLRVDGKHVVLRSVGPGDGETRTGPTGPHVLKVRREALSVRGVHSVQPVRCSFAMGRRRQSRRFAGATGCENAPCPLAPHATMFGPGAKSMCSSTSLPARRLAPGCALRRQGPPTSGKSRLAVFEAARMRVGATVRQPGVLGPAAYENDLLIRPSDGNMRARGRSGRPHKPTCADPVAPEGHGERARTRRAGGPASGRRWPRPAPPDGPGARALRR